MSNDKTVYVGIGNTFSFGSNTVTGPHSSLIQFNNLTSSPFGESQPGLWNTGSYSYVNLSPDIFDQRFALTLTGNFKPKAGVAVGIYMWHKISQYTSAVDPAWNTPGVVGDRVYYGAPIDSNAGVSNVSGYGYGLYGPYNEVNTNIDPSHGYVQYDWVSGNFTASILTNWLDGSNSVRDGYVDRLGPNDELRFSIQIVNFDPGLTAGVVTINDGALYNQIDNTLVEGQILNYNSAIPQKIKQKDFLNWLCSMFNLYIEPSRQWPNTLIIEPRDDYYSAGTTYDWTEKLDKNNGILADITSNTQAKQTLYTYTQDKDWLNTLYQNQYNNIFGQYIYNQDNDFSISEDTISVGFAPTVTSMVPNSNSQVLIPRLYKDSNNNFASGNERTDTNIKILYRYPHLLNMSVNQNPLVFSGVAHSNSNNQYGYTASLGHNWVIGTFSTGYPYVGHFDDPFKPAYDLNFGETLTSFIPGTQSGLTFSNVTTINNLINNYWINTLDDITNITSRLLTVQMNLTALDIANTYLNSLIYLFVNGSGQYYHINSITYDPTGYNLSQVELVKVTETTIQKRSYGIEQGVGIVVQNQSTLNQLVLPGSVVITGPGNELTGTAIISNGQSNQLGGISQIATGNFNILSGDNTLVNGNFNQVGIRSQYVDIVGLSNLVAPDVSNIHIVGASNSIPELSTNINIAGSNNTILSPTQSGTFSTPSDIFIMGQNNTIAPGLTGVSLFGSGINATQSNTIYSGQNIQMVNGSTIIGVVAGGAGGSNNSIQYNEGGIFTADANLTWDPVNHIYSEYNTNAIANSGNSHAEGNGNTITGTSPTSHIEGSGNTIANISPTSHAEGISNVINFSQFAHAEGYGNIIEAASDVAHIEGSGNIINNSQSSAHAEGSLNIIKNSPLSHVEGYINSIIGADTAHAGGSGASASHFAEWTRSSVNGGVGYKSFGQYGIVMYSTQTTNATPTSMFIGYPSISTELTLNPGEGYIFNLQGSFKIQNGTEFGLINLSNAYLYNNSGVMTWMGGIAPTPSVTTTTFLIGTGVTLSLNTNSLTITVTGLAATNINWVCKVEYTMVKF
jgi:hypothetical protein